MRSNGYFNIYQPSGDHPVFCYRSGLAVYEETFTCGALVASGWNCAGYPLNVLAGYPTRIDHKLFTHPAAFRLEMDGQDLSFDWELEGFSENHQDTCTESILTLRSRIKPLRVKVHTRLDGTQMLTRWLEMENCSDTPMNLSRLVLWGGGLEVMDRTDLTRSDEVETFYCLGYFDSDSWGREGQFVWRDLQPTATRIDTRFGHDRYRHPMVFLRNRITGVLYFCQIGWSGGCGFTLDYHATPDNKRSILSLEAEITGYAPLLVLRPGEIYTSPEIHMGAILGGIDDAVNEMHSHIRRSVLCATEIDPSSCLIGGGMGAEHDMSIDTTKSFIRQFAQMGAEVFLLDAGWVCPPGFPIDWVNYNGTNTHDVQRYPGGMQELRDYCHSLGMKFGLWMEVERLGNFAPALKEHPHWIVKDVYGQPAKSNMLNLTIPEAAQWAEAELARIITEYGLDLLRVDHNPGSTNHFVLEDTGAGRKECLSIRHTDAVYRIYGNLKRRFPHVIFENCASGGGRTDLGIMKHFNHTWVSDWQRAPRSLLITNGMTMALPPERVDRLFAGMNCHPFGSLDLQMRNTMLCHMTLNVIAPADAELSSQQMAFVRHSTDIYKHFIRSFLPTAKIFHHTPEAAECMQSGILAMEIASSCGDRGAAAVYSLPGVKADAYRFIPKGLDASKTYKVTLDNSGAVMQLSGYQLQNSGIRIHIPTSMSSELILFEAAQS